MSFNRSPFEGCPQYGVYNPTEPWFSSALAEKELFSESGVPFDYRHPGATRFVGKVTLRSYDSADSVSRNQRGYQFNQTAYEFFQRSAKDTQQFVEAVRSGYLDHKELDELDDDDLRELASMIVALPIYLSRTHPDFFNNGTMPDIIVEAAHEFKGIKTSIDYIDQPSKVSGKEFYDQIDRSGLLTAGPTTNTSDLGSLVCPVPAKTIAYYYNQFRDGSSAPETHITALYDSLHIDFGRLRNFSDALMITLDNVPEMLSIMTQREAEIANLPDGDLRKPSLNRLQTEDFIALDELMIATNELAYRSLGLTGQPPSLERLGLLRSHLLTQDTLY